MLRDRWTIGILHDEPSNISIDSSTMLLPTGGPIDVFFLSSSLKTRNVSHALLVKRELNLFTFHYLKELLHYW